MAMSAGVAVRDATPGDAAAIAGVQVRSWRAGYRALMPGAVLDDLSVTAREQRWTEILAAQTPPAYTLVAATEDDVHGFCSLVLPSRDPDAGARTGEVAALYVDPPHWRRGIGRTLLAAALGRVPPAGWDDVTLWVLAGNAAARRFYAAAGFRPDGADASHVASGAAQVRLRRPLRH